MRQQLYLITGVMASGKSTIAELLAAKTDPCVHLRGDVFRRMIVSGREEMSETPSPEAFHQLHLRYQLTAETAKTYYKNGFSVVIQDNYYGAELGRMLGLLEGYAVNVAVLCPRAEVVKEREQNRGKTGYTGFSVESLHDTFMKETPRIGFWLDNSDLTPQQSADEILGYFTE